MVGEEQPRARGARRSRSSVQGAGFLPLGSRSNPDQTHPDPEHPDDEDPAVAEIRRKARKLRERPAPESTVEELEQPEMADVPSVAEALEAVAACRAILETAAPAPRGRAPALGLSPMSGGNGEELHELSASPPAKHEEPDPW